MEKEETSNKSRCFALGSNDLLDAAVSDDAERYIVEKWLDGYYHVVYFKPNSRWGNGSVAQCGDVRYAERIAFLLNQEKGI
jgi:hypothetical protein